MVIIATYGANTEKVF